MPILQPINTAIGSRHAWQNRVQSVLLLAAMAGFMALLGYLIWGWVGLLLLFWSAIIGSLFIPTYSPKLLLRMYAARPICRHQAPVLWAIVAELSERANLETYPSLYYIPSQVPNAFTMGSKPASMIALSDGLLQRLSQPELVAVVAHEISHIAHDDGKVMGLADLFSRTTTLLSLIGQLLLLINLPLLLLADIAINWVAIILLIVAPVISALAQQALSRTREFDADLNAARLTGDPEGLAAALLKIDDLQQRWQDFFIPGYRIPEPSSLRTHPPTAERVTRLLALRPQFSAWERGLPSSDLESFRSAPFAKPVHRRPRWHVTGLWH